MKTVDTITVAELTQMAENMYENIVKAVVDIEGGSLVVDAPLHVDEEQVLLESGSRQADLWGINLHPAKFGTDEFIEFDSMINVRADNERSRDVVDNNVRQKIITIVKEKVTG